MKETSVQELYELFLRCKSVTINSQTVPKASLFVALRGEKFNANQFVDEAIKNGAAAAIVDDPSLDYEFPDKIFYVRDSLIALEAIAAQHRGAFEIPIIAITGSCGKTTTKELSTSVLSAKYKVCATQGNLNSRVGVPLTLLSLDKTHQLAVIELGADKAGDIAIKCRLVRPNYGIITSIGLAHIKSFGSLDAVERTKNELYNYLQENGGTALVDSDNPVLLRLSKCLTKKIYYGAKASVENFIQGRARLHKSRLCLRWCQHGGHVHDVALHLTGLYNLSNCLAAVALGKKFEISDNEINAALAAYRPASDRSRIVETARNIIISDCYNANPLSMSEALQSFSAMNAERKVVILGDMLELGAVSYDEHLRIRKSLRQLTNLESAIFVGQNFIATKASVPKQEKEIFVETTQEAEHWCEKLTDSLVLLKGSRGIGLEILLDYL